MVAIRARLVGLVFEITCVGDHPLSQAVVAVLGAHLLDISSLSGSRAANCPRISVRQAIEVCGQHLHESLAILRGVCVAPVQFVAVSAFHIGT